VDRSTISDGLFDASNLTGWCSFKRSPARKDSTIPGIALDRRT